MALCLDVRMGIGLLLFSLRPKITRGSENQMVTVFKAALGG